MTRSTQDIFWESIKENSWYQSAYQNGRRAAGNENFKTARDAMTRKDMLTSYTFWGFRHGFDDARKEQEV